MNFKEEIQSVINKHSIDPYSNTSDYHLQQLLIGYLEADKAHFKPVVEVVKGLHDSGASYSSPSSSADCEFNIESDAPLVDDSLLLIYMKIKNLERFSCGAVLQKVREIRMDLANVANNYELIKKDKDACNIT